MSKKQKPVASVSHGDGFMIGSSDVIRWDDVMNIQGTDIKVSKAVELGHKYELPFAPLLERDLKSEEGLLITFPVAILMSQLQEKVGTGAQLLKLVKP